MSISNKILASRFYSEVIGQAQFHLLDELVAEDLVDHDPGPGQAPGRAGFGHSLADMRRSFPDLHVEVHSLIAESDRVGVRLTLTGTQHGAYGGVPATGRRVSVSGFEWLRIEGGRVVERCGIVDGAGLLMQLGAIPGPTPGDLKAMSAKYYELLDAGRGDLTSIRRELLHPHFVTHFPGQRDQDADALQQMVQSFWSAFPDVVHALSSQICEGDTVFNHIAARATHKDTFVGVAATGKVVEVNMMSAHRYVEGKLYEQWTEVDMLDVLRQLGAIQAPAGAA